ncbi:MAG TPA: enolase C-terminal domain-like protein, partial [Chloroflexota bacterium]
MGRIELSIAVEKYPLAAPFRISGFVMEEQNVLVVQLRDGNHVGRGEASGVYYLHDTAERMAAAVEALRDILEAGIDRVCLQELLPAGGARNALDCAFWELEAARTDTPVWKLAGVPPPNPLVTTFTLGAEDPAIMVARARKYAHARSLKLKLTGDLDLDIARLRAVRAARPDAWLAVDANQGYTKDAL